MSDHSGRLQVLFEAALQDYEEQTGIVLVKHPLAEQLQNCDSVESVTTVLREQTQAFGNFRGKDKVLRSLKTAVSVLHKLSATADIGRAIGLVRPYALIGCLMCLTLIQQHFLPVTAIQTSLAVLLSVCAVLYPLSAYLSDIQAY
jgi:hypothetical protein